MFWLLSFYCFQNYWNNQEKSFLLTTTPTTYTHTHKALFRVFQTLLKITEVILFSSLFFYAIILEFHGFVTLCCSLETSWEYREFFRFLSAIEVMRNLVSRDGLVTSSWQVCFKTLCKYIVNIKDVYISVLSLLPSIPYKNIVRQHIL